MKGLSKSFCIKEGLKEFYLSREVEPMTDCYLEDLVKEVLDVIVEEGIKPANWFYTEELCDFDRAALLCEVCNYLAKEVSGYYYTFKDLLAGALMFSKYQAPADCSITVEESWGMNALMFSSKVIGTVYVHCPSLDDKTVDEAFDMYPSRWIGYNQWSKVYRQSLAVDLIQDYDLLVLMARATTRRRTSRTLNRNVKARKALAKYLQLPYEEVCCR